MKPFIPEFNELDEGYFKQLWDSALLVFDTSALLNLYRYPQASSDKLLSLADRLANRLWIPHQVALEYHRNLPHVLDEHDKLIDELQKQLKHHYKALEGILDSTLKDRHPLIDAKELRETISESYRHASDYVVEQQQRSSTSDLYKSIESHLQSLFSCRVGPPYSTSRLLEIYRAGKERYELKIPPGFMDEKEKQGAAKYGDLVIWFQLLDKAAECKLPIIFITDDLKDDWLEGKRGARSGPRRELCREMWDHAGVAFHIYSLVAFMKHAGEHLNQPVDNSIVVKMQAVRDRLDSLARDEAKLRELVVPSDRQALAEATVHSMDLLLERFLSMETIRAGIQEGVRKLNLSVQHKESLLAGVDYDTLRVILGDLVKKKFMLRIEPLIAQSGPDWFFDFATLQTSLLELASKLGSDDAKVDEEEIANAIRLAGENSPMVKDMKTIGGEVFLDHEIASTITLFLERALATASRDWGKASPTT